VKVHPIAGPLPASLARALAEFEAPFTYPLGPGKFFRITHGEDYTLFFRTLGDGVCFIAEHQDRVEGTLGTAVRRLWMPNGTVCRVGYLGDLKIATNARGGTMLVRLARAAEGWLRPQVKAGFGVVMDGTAARPDAYTGRAGIPAFRDIGHVIVFRIPRSDEASRVEPCPFETTQEAGLACYRRLSVGRYACAPGEAQKRSQMNTVWLMNADGSACGMLEDTRKAKRLITEDGSELVSAHLSCFAYNTVSAGVRLIEIAQRQLARLALPALFVAVAQPDAKELGEFFRKAAVTAAPATVYGAGLPTGNWNINSSEI
jgi:hypothetical protein